MTTNDRQRFEASTSGLGEAILLRTILKNNPAARNKVLQAIREVVSDLGVSVDEQIWDHLVIANAAELEGSKAHVIVSVDMNNRNE